MPSTTNNAVNELTARERLVEEVEAERYPGGWEAVAEEAAGVADPPGPPQLSPEDEREIAARLAVWR